MTPTGAEGIESECAAPSGRRCVEGSLVKEPRDLSVGRNNRCAGSKISAIFIGVKEGDGHGPRVRVRDGYIRSDRRPGGWINSCPL